MDDQLYAFEPDAAIRAFDDYYSLGPSRSLRKLLDLYATLPAPDDAPTLSLETLERWCAKYAWKARCAEKEARIAEKSEALLIEDRAALKRRRLSDQGRVIALSMSLIEQCHRHVTGFHEEIVHKLIGIDPETGEGVYQARIETVPNVPEGELLKVFPKAVAALLAAQKEQKQELGDDEQRMHVTIDMVVNAMPEPLRAPMRELLYQELTRPEGIEADA